MSGDEDQPQRNRREGNDSDGEGNNRGHRYLLLLQRYLLGLANRSGDSTGDEEEDEDEDCMCTSSDEANTARTAPPPITWNQDQRIAQEISMRTGCSPNSPQKSIMSMLQQREMRPIPSGFQKTEKCHITQRMLPSMGHPVARFDSQVFCGTYSREGDMFMSACQDRHVRIYDTKNWKLKKNIIARDVGWSIIDTDYSPDQKWIIYSSWSQFVHLVNIGDYEYHEGLDFRPSSQRFCLFSIKFSPDTTEIVGGSSDRCLYIYNIERKERVLKLTAHDDDINSVCWGSNSSHLIYSASDDCLAKAWDRRTMGKGQTTKPVGIMVGHMEGITHVSTKGDERYFITNGKDQCIKLWDLRKMTDANQSSTPKRRSNWDYRYTDEFMYRSQDKIFSGETVHPSDSSVKTYRGHKVFQTLIRCHFTSSEATGQKYIVTGSSDKCVYIYDVLTGAVAAKLCGHSATIRDVSCHPFDQKIVSTSWDGTVRQWEYVPKDKKKDLLETKGRHC